jgi:hypothetical protein
VPDVVGNLRVDQAWGSAQIGGALHQVNVSYYNTTAGTTIGLFGNQEASGNPNDEWGWAAMAGIRLNAPFIGTGDYFAAQGIYTEGALRYIFQNPNNNWWLIVIVRATASPPMVSTAAALLTVPPPVST